MAVALGHFLPGLMLGVDFQRIEGDLQQLRAAQPLFQGSVAAERGRIHLALDAGFLISFLRRAVPGRLAVHMGAFRKHPSPGAPGCDQEEDRLTADQRIRNAARLTLVRPRVVGQQQVTSQSSA